MAVAALPMYDLPEIRAVTVGWWHGLAGHFRNAGIADVPDDLAKDGECREFLERPDLLFSQTCGYPFTHELKGSVRLVATPCHNAPGCTCARYSSMIVVADDNPADEPLDLEGSRAAVNAFNSQSGWNALRGTFGPLRPEGGFFTSIDVSGSHRRSLGAVAEGKADVCAIDCMTHALLVRHAPEALDGTRVLASTFSAPGLPYVTAAGSSDDTLGMLREGLRAALDDPVLAPIRAELLISDAMFLEASDYVEIRETADEWVGWR